MSDLLEFSQSRNIYEYGPILEPLAEDFTELFYHAVLVWCNVISDSQPNLVWEVWLIKLNNESVGICGLYSLGNLNKENIPVNKNDIKCEELWLGWLGLIPKLRNNGLGQQILEHLIINAKKIGCKRLYSYVDKNGAPLNFYKKHGFEVIGKVKEYCEKNEVDPDNFCDEQDYIIKKELE